MYKILIISKDEYIKKQILSKLEGYDFEINYADEASNVIEDTGIINTKHIDIIIFDTHKCHIDGMKTIRKLKEHYPKAKYIIVRQYIDSEYLRQALNMGVNGFILKPIKDIDIHNIIDNVIKQLDCEYETELLKATVKNLKIQTRRVTDEQKFNFIMHNEKEILPRIQRESSSIGIDETNRYLLLLINIDACNYYNVAIRYQDIKNVKLSIENIINEIEICSKMLVVNNQKDMDQMFILVINNQKHVLIKEAYGLASKLKTKSRKLLNVYLTMAISGVQEIITNELYRQAKLALDLRLIHGNNKIYIYNESISHHGIKYQENKFNLLEKFIKEYDYENIYTILRDILFKNDPKHVSSLYIRFMYFQVISLLFKLCNNQAIDIERYLSIDTINGEALNHLDSCEDIVKNLFSIIVNILESGNLEGVECRDIIGNVKLYIEQNYYNKLTVKDMATHFSINANYLSTLFKNQIGKTITQYITEIRINRSIELLKHTEAGAAQIGQCVGYNDAQYFYRVFKKTTGKTTKEYRS